MGGQTVTGLPLLVSELAITMSNQQVWLSIGLALLLGGLCLLFGTWVARTVGLLRSDAPAGEILGVGLASGLMVLAAWWAAIWSAGRSSFTPVAVGFAIALALALARRARRPAAAGVSGSEGDGDAATPPRASRRRSLLLTAFGGAVFVVVVALLYGATLAPSPRNGVQPMEFADEAYYAVLGRDLATTGTETNLPPSGFTELQGFPSQSWYHWGELWLAAGVITVFGTAPMAARNFVVLPLLLLAAAALTGTLVRRFTGTTSRGAYVFGFLACLFLAPVPTLEGSFFSSWSAGLIFMITVYGLAAVAALLALYGVAVLRTRPSTWALACFAGAAAALILPAHVVVAALALVGVGSIWIIRTAQSLLSTRRLPVVSLIWRRTIVATGIVVAVTLAWGLLTGHGLASGGASYSVPAFGYAWVLAVAITILGAGVFLAIPIAWFLVRRDVPLQADLYLGTIVLLVVGAIAWGARLGDYTMFYVFFGGVTVIATPVAAVAARMLWARLRDLATSRLTLGAVIALCLLQLTLGVAIAVTRLQQFGPRLDHDPMPVSLLGTIRRLPEDAKLAYPCQALEEISFVDTSLLSIDANTGRSIVPMCFEADVFSVLNGARPSVQTPASDFAKAPQRRLYPDALADPSSAAVAAFLKGHGIDYIYADAGHPNSLVADAVVLSRSGSAEVLRVP